ncbi:HAD hydrolase-like protein [Chitinophaga sp. Mgbs1]|uniref:HAD hydrolase-like protein n=1 Tax=Chitinophaga solisilvae TaxID=1233460 RepID=A0A433WDM8_9BACT|nr:HAD hydrolase-like protein [Chitinophaga solisilvae]
MMVLVFDLDDTLYDEITFVKSGYKAVAGWLHQHYGLDEAQVYHDLEAQLMAKGRDNAFNEVLGRYGIFSTAIVRKCLSVYRLHSPVIRLNEDAVKCLERFREYPKYIVTDGNKIVQGAKIKALDFKPDQIKKAFVTYRYGRKHSKPSPYCFLKISTLEGVSPENVIYIGDNPNKDFVGIKPLGFKTIRILQGMFKDVRKEAAYEADLNIRSLNELTEDLIRKNFNL